MNVLTSTATLENISHEGQDRAADDSARAAGPLSQSAETTARRSPGLGPLLAAAGAGVLGAGLVAVGVFVMTPLSRINDTRILALSHDVDDLKQQLIVLSGKVHDLEAELVSSGEAVGSVRESLQSQAGGLASLRRQLADLGQTVEQARAEQAGVASPALLGVAVVQLRARLERGLPFDWELVNLWGIAGRKPEAAVELSRLAPFAAEGLPVVSKVNADLEQLVLKVGVMPPTWRRGLGAVEWLIGTNMTGSIPSSDQILLVRVSASAQRGDYAAATRELRGIGPDYAADAEPVIAELEHHAIAQSAVARLMELSREGLASQARATASVIDHKTGAAQPQ